MHALYLATIGGLCVHLLQQGTSPPPPVRSLAPCPSWMKCKKCTHSPSTLGGQLAVARSWISCLSAMAVYGTSALIWHGGFTLSLQCWAACGIGTERDEQGGKKGDAASQSTAHAPCQATAGRISTCSGIYLEVLSSCRSAQLAAPFRHPGILTCWDHANLLDWCPLPPPIRYKHVKALGRWDHTICLTSPAAPFYIPRLVP